MIEINLLPQEKRVKIKRASATETKNYLYLIPLILAIIFFWHICLAVTQVVSNAQLAGLKNKWKMLEPQRKAWEEAKVKYNLAPEDVEMMRQLANEKICWAEKLHTLSSKLPAGIWFNEVSAVNKVFLIRGVAISLDKQELILINKFLNNLKDEKTFFKDFENLESVQMQDTVISGYHTMNFTINGKMK